jgi:hypothetical protein
MNEPHLRGMFVIILTDPLHLLLLQVSLKAVGIEPIPVLTTKVVCKSMRLNGSPITKGCRILTQPRPLIPKNENK